MNRASPVAQTRQNRYYIIAHLFAREQRFALQITEIDQFIAERKARALQPRRHPKGRLSDIKHDLPWKFSEQPVNSQSVLSHALGHVGIVAALQLEMDKSAVCGFPEEIRPGILNFRKLNIKPPLNRNAG
jgi:hypothetical protein